MRAFANARARLPESCARSFPRGSVSRNSPCSSSFEELSRPPKAAEARSAGTSAFSPRFCYSYFALYGDPLLDPTLDPYPDGYLARLAASGVDGVWLQAVLTRLAPFPWDARQSKHYETRLQNLRLLVERARRHGVSVYLYLNEPRACPVSFFATRPDLKGVAEGEFAALCTSVPEVREYLASAVESICRAVPGLARLLHHHRLGEPDQLLVAWQRQGLPALRQTPAGRRDRRSQRQLLRRHPARGQRAEVDRLGLGLAR